MTEYVRKEVRAWNSISEKDREFIKKVATFADDIDDLGMTIKRALVSIYDKLNDDYKNIEKSDLKDMDETDQILEKLSDFSDIIYVNVEFTNQNLTKDERLQIYKEWAESPTIPEETKEERKINKRYKEIQQSTMNKIDKLVPISYITLNIDKLKNNEYNIDDFKNKIKELEDLAKTDETIKKTPSSYYIKVLTELNKNIHVISKIYKVKDSIQEKQNSGKYKTFNDILDSSTNEVMEKVNKPANKEGYNKYNYIVGKNKGETYENFIRSCRADVRSYLQKMYNPTVAPTAELTEQEQKEQKMINNFNNLTEEQKTTFLDWIPTYNVDLKNVSGKTVPPAMRTIFQKILGDPTKKRDDITAQDKLDIINTIGGYAYSKSPAFNESLNESLNGLLNGLLNPQLTNPLNNFVVEKLPEIEQAADEFDDGFEYMENLEGQNENENINSSADLDTIPGNGQITEEEQQNEPTEEEQQNEDITPNPGIDDKTDEQQQINKNNLPIVNDDILPPAPTEPVEEEQTEEQADNKEIVPIPNKSVPAVVGGLVDSWFTKDSSIADVLEDTQKIISLLTPEQYDRIEEDLAEQLIHAADDGGNKLFQDKAQVIKFLRSFRNKQQKQYKLPVAIERIEKRNTGLNYQLSPLILRSRRTNTKSYKFYNE